MNNRVGLVVDDRYLDHRIVTPSPENPERLRNLATVVREQFAQRCQLFSGREAGFDDIELVHSRFYLEQLKEHSVNGNPFSYDKDTYLMEQSIYTAQLATGGCLDLADRLLGDELDSGFALIRPPGHHAEPGRGMGFCVFNNVSITAEYLRKKYGLNRILIIDFDAHHGNGTQEAFYDTDEVMVMSLHQRDIFPFSGDVSEVGTEKGLGYTINVPVYSQFGDAEYTFLLGRLLQVVAEQYLPQIILVSAGYDAHQDDSISGTILTTEWFGLATALIKQAADSACDGRLLMVLEGGYNPVSLESSVLETLDSLCTKRLGKIGVLHSERGNNLLVDHPFRSCWTL
ncbi:histone deacetylase family protein [Desulforhopalus sp. 52FAK]